MQATQQLCKGLIRATYILCIEHPRLMQSGIEPRTSCTAEEHSMQRAIPTVLLNTIWNLSLYYCTTDYYFSKCCLSLLQPGDGPGESHPDEHRQAICQVAVTCWECRFFVKIRRWTIYSCLNFCHCKGYLGWGDREQWWAWTCMDTCK
jgi:hypothetical protein